MSIKISPSIVHNSMPLDYPAQREAQISDSKVGSELNVPVKTIALRSLTTLSSASSYALPSSRTAKSSMPTQFENYGGALTQRAIPMRTMSSVVRTTIASAYQMNSTPPSDYLGVRRQATSAAVLKTGGTLKRIDEVDHAENKSVHVIGSNKSTYFPNSTGAVSFGSLRRFKDSYSDNLAGSKMYGTESPDTRVYKNSGVLDATSRTLNDIKSNSFNVTSNSGALFYNSQNKQPAMGQVFKLGTAQTLTKTQNSLPAPSLSVGLKPMPASQTVKGQKDGIMQAADEQHKITQRYVVPFSKRMEVSCPSGSTELLNAGSTVNSASASRNETLIPSIQLKPGQSLSSLHSLSTSQRQNHSWTRNSSKNLANELTIQSARAFGEATPLTWCSKTVSAADRNILDKSTLQKHSLIHDSKYLMLHMQKDSVEKLIHNLQILSSSLVHMKPLTERLEKDILAFSENEAIPLTTALKLSEKEIEAVKQFIKTSNTDLTCENKPLDNIQKLIKSVSDQLNVLLENNNIFTTNNPSTNKLSTETDNNKAAQNILNRTLVPKGDSTYQTESRNAATNFAPLLAPLDKVKKLNKFSEQTTQDLLCKSLKMVQDNQQQKFSLQREYMYSLQIETSNDENKTARCIDVIKIYSLPDILLMMEFLTAQECKELREQEDQATQNTTAEETMIQVLRRRLAAILKIKTEDVGEFKFIECKPDEVTFQHSLAYKNTCALIYLNDVPTGGTLKFETLRLQVLPRCGTAIVWQNTKKDKTDLNSSMAAPSIQTHVIICSINNFFLNTKYTPDATIKTSSDFSLSSFKLNTQNSQKLPKTLRRRRSVENNGVEQSLFKLQTVEEEDRNGTFNESL